MPEQNDAQPRNALRGVFPWLILAAVVIGLDQFTKSAILERLQYAERVAVVPGLFDLTLLFNPGAAFSFLAGQDGWQRWFFTAIALGASMFISWLLWRHHEQRVFSLALALVLGGALGNLVDRLLHGHVVDFLLFHWGSSYFPAFNVADSAITMGAILLFLDEILRIRRQRREATPR